MIINIGDDNYILKENIIGIIDKNSVEKSSVFNEFIINLKEKNAFNNNDNKEVKSYIITEKNGKTEIHESKISSKTLEKRNNLNRWR